MQILVEIPDHLWLTAQYEAEAAGLPSLSEWASEALIERLERGQPAISPSGDD